MPLIRYRTGDLSRFLPDSCPCGTALRRMDRVRGRLKDFAQVGESHWLGIVDLDDVLFPIPGLLDYQAVLNNGNNHDRLDVVVRAGGCEGATILDAVHRALTESQVLRGAIHDGSISIGSVEFATERLVATGTSKRSIHDQRSAASNTNLFVTSKQVTARRPERRRHRLMEDQLSRTEDTVGRVVHMGSYREGIERTRRKSNAVRVQVEVACNEPVGENIKIGLSEELGKLDGVVVVDSEPDWVFSIIALHYGHLVELSVILRQFFRASKPGTEQGTSAPGEWNFAETRRLGL